MMNGIFNFSSPSIPYGPSTETVESGGGAATPVAEDFSTFLQNVLAGGGGGQGVGRSPVEQTSGIMQALNELIAGPDVRGQQSAIQQVIQQDTERQTADLRERFTSGGGSQGTPSAVAEALFRSETTPRIATAVGDLDLRANQQRIQALMSFLQLLGGFAGRGVPQARTDVLVKPGPFDFITGGVEAGASIAGAAGGGG
ncbi:hypothetical protein LCGC14_1965100 [marine sediment metagenome]|uniref:Uncharacterized protein n=1 Tax=marine sediment metagenome TaxID=412755 RepID=A0A0F9IAG4_9ZZZZ